VALKLEGRTQENSNGYVGKVRTGYLTYWGVCEARQDVFGRCLEHRKEGNQNDDDKTKRDFIQGLLEGNGIEKK
jgi:hypothetical protein